MHYKDGTPATIGDLIRGHGYNVKNEDGTPKELVGVVVSLSSGETCNLQIGYDIVGLTPFSHHNTGEISDGRYTMIQGRCKLEYGETKAFEKIG